MSKVKITDSFIAIMSSKEFFSILAFCLLVATVTTDYYKIGAAAPVSLFGKDGNADCFGTCAKTCTLANPNNTCNAIKSLLVVAIIATLVAVLMNYSLIPKMVMPGALPSMSSLLGFAFVLSLIALIITISDDESGFVAPNVSIAEASNGGPVMLGPAFHCHWAAVVALFIAFVFGSCGCSFVKF